jgi:serine/threonine protein kinase
MQNVPNRAVGLATSPETGAASGRGERYGRYYLLERIGRGGMAEVFRAVAEGVEGFRRVFVVKRIRPEKSGSPEFIQMFCDEARICALLNHPNIVQVYDFGQIDGTYFLAMEYLRGKDLGAVMRAVRLSRTAINPGMAAYVAQQAAMGLHHAHTVVGADGQPIKIVHRDVTPSNIMLLRTGAVKVLDFGIAQTSNVARQIETGGGRVKGKLAYLSPEQVRLTELDGRSDVFGLGVVLWEMLTGQRLFAADNEFLTMRNVLTQPVPAPSSKRAEVPAALDTIVARALQRDRDSRYATAQEMADDLERFLAEAHPSSQAMPRLLHDLFGEDTTDNTPALPDVGHFELGRAPAQGPGDSDLEVVLEIDPGEGSAPSAVGLRSELVEPAGVGRRLISVLALAALAGCLLWAMWRGKHPAAHPPLSTSGNSFAHVATPIEPVAPAPTPTPMPAPTLPPRSATVRVIDGSALRSVARAKPGKKRGARRISNDVTLDPFK